jgi:hypothetical protein
VIGFPFQHAIYKKRISLQHLTACVNSIKNRLITMEFLINENNSETSGAGGMGSICADTG